MNLISTAIFAVISFLTWPNLVQAQDVTLISRDKSIEISGNLLGFDGDFYRIETVYGELTVDSTGVHCEGPACPNLETFIAEISFNGSPVIGRVLLPALIEGFARQSGLVAVREEPAPNQLGYWLQSESDGDSIGHFVIHLSDSDEAFADLLALDADVVMSTRVASSDEIQLAEEIGLGNLKQGGQQAFLGMDSVIFNVPASSELKELRLSQMKSVLKGSTVDWRELIGGESAPIQIHADPNAVELFGDLSKDVLSLGPETIASLESAPPFPEKPDHLTAGLAFKSSPFEEFRAVGLSSECGIVHEQTDLAIRSGEVPFSFPLILYRPMRRLPEIGQEFFDFLESPAGQRVVSRAGYVSASPEFYPYHTIWYRMTNAMLQVVHAEEFEKLQTAVSILKDRELFGGAFRFEKGGDNLNAASLALLRQLRRMVELGELDRRELLFVGFGSDDGQAEKVQRAFLKELEVSSVEAQTAWVELGDAMPLECASSDNADALNSRVEVWVR